MDKERLKYQTKLDELTAAKFPVKDHLIATLDKKGAPVRDLPPLIATLQFPRELCQDLITTWNFLSTFRYCV